MMDGYGRPLFLDGTFPLGRPSCASVFDAALESTDAPGFFSAIEDGRLWGGPWGSEVHAMSHDVRMLRMVQVLMYAGDEPMELARDAWFAEFGVEFHRWLAEIGAPTTARYVQELLDLYPGGIPLPSELDRDELLTAAEEADPMLWTELCARYPALEEEIAGALRGLLRERGTPICAECDALRSRFAEPLPPPLAEIVAAPSSGPDFLEALTSWLDAPVGRPRLGFDQQPDVGRMLWVLGALSTSAAAGGMVHFLHSGGVGGFFTKLASWAKAIAAPNTVAYVKAVSAELKRLNGGKLPPMGDSARIATLHELELQDEAAGGRGLFDEIDEQYGQLVVAELAPKLRSYVQAHLVEIEGELMGAVGTAAARVKRMKR